MNYTRSSISSAFLVAGLLGGIAHGYAQTAVPSAPGASTSAPAAASVPGQPDSTAIRTQLKGLRSLPNDDRWKATRDLATEIAQMPAGEEKVNYATALTGLSTEGDPGLATWQAVAGTLAGALEQHPMKAGQDGTPNAGYTELARLVTYFGATTTLHNAQLDKAEKAFRKAEEAVSHPDFSLTVLNSAQSGLGPDVRLQNLHGRYVIVNFWATWCPPCRKEMPDLQELSKQYGNDKLVILGISSEDPAKVTAFLDRKKYTYPVLIDSWQKVVKQFNVEGIPQTFLYDTSGTLIAHWVDQVSKQQILDKLQARGFK